MATTFHRHPLGLTWVQAGGLQRAAHALRAGDDVWLIDPFEDAAAVGAAAELGRAAGVIQLLDRHNRDGAAIAQRLEAPLLRLPQAAPADSPFTVVRVIDRPWWHEVALWWEAERTLVVAEALGTAPHFAGGRRAGLHPMLRLTPPRGAVTAHRPERLLVGHGPPLLADAASAVDEALSFALTDIPRIVASLPQLLRAG